jgi:hypothetical protein
MPKSSPFTRYDRRSRRYFWRRTGLLGPTPPNAPIVQEWLVDPAQNSWSGAVPCENGATRAGGSPKQNSTQDLSVANTTDTEEAGE